MLSDLIRLDDLTLPQLLREARALIPTLDPGWTDHNPSDPGIALIELLAWLTELTAYRLDQLSEESRRVFLGLLAGAEAPATQPIEELERQVLTGLRGRYRAVTAADYEHLLTTAWPIPTAEAPSYERRLLRVLALPEVNLEAPAGPTEEAPGHMSLVVMPRGAPLRETLILGDPPGPAAPPPDPQPRFEEITTTHLRFNRGEDEVSDPAFTWEGGGPVTVELWVKIDADGVDGTLNGGVSVGHQFNPNRFNLLLPGNDGHLRFQYGDARVNGVVSISIEPWIGQWIHVAAVSEGIGGHFMGIYINGELVAPSQASDGPSQPLSTASLGRFRTFFMAGAAYDLRIWDHVRPAEDIQRDRERRLSGAEPGLALYWPGDEGQGDTVRDLARGVDVPIASAQWTASRTRRVEVPPEHQPEPPPIARAPTSPWPFEVQSAAAIDLTARWTAGPPLLQVSLEDAAGIRVASRIGPSPLFLRHIPEEGGGAGPQTWHVVVDPAPSEGPPPRLDGLEIHLQGGQILRPAPALLGSLDADLLDARRTLTTQLHVVGPGYVVARLEASLYLHPDALPQVVRGRASEALFARTHPETGGDGGGWPFGRSLYVSELYDLLDRVQGVDFVEAVALSAQPADRLEVTREGAQVGLRALPHELILLREVELTVFEARGDGFERSVT